LGAVPGPRTSFSSAAAPFGTPAVRLALHRLIHQETDAQQPSRAAVGPNYRIVVTAIPITAISITATIRVSEHARLATIGMNVLRLLTLPLCLSRHQMPVVLAAFALRVSARLASN
jgi:hypothetical protein